MEFENYGTEIFEKNSKAISTTVNMLLQFSTAQKRKSHLHIAQLTFGESAVNITTIE